MNIGARGAAFRRSASPWWSGGVQVVLLVLNLQVLAWVILRSGRGAGSRGMPQPEGGRAALTGHVEKAEPLAERGDFEGLPIEVWARAPANASSPEVAAVRALLSAEDLGALRALCGRTLYHGLQNVVVSHETGLRSFFATG